jgi:CheY-like chemotaxis protein
MTQSLPPKSLVLYADDDTDDLALIREAFSNYMHALDLLTFKDGFELLRYVESLAPLQTVPCLIILDVNMPRLNGLEILKKIRSQKELIEVPVVLFSTSTLPSEAAYAESLHAGFITKPLVSSQIPEIVERLLSFCSEEVRRRINRQ